MARDVDVCQESFKSGWWFLIAAESCKSCCCDVVAEALVVRILVLRVF